MLALVVTIAVVLPGSSAAGLVSSDVLAVESVRGIDADCVDLGEPEAPAAPLPCDDQPPEPNSDRPTPTSPFPNDNLSGNSLVDPPHRLAVWQLHASFIGHSSRNLLYTLLHLRN